jgi:hypothetical protein
MTGASHGCVAIACPYAPHISRQARHNGHLCGTADLHFRTIADMTELARHDGKDTANAVRW